MSFDDAHQPHSHVGTDELVLRIPDPSHTYEHVSLWHDLDLALGDPHFTKTHDVWEWRTPTPPLDRFEYLLEVAAGHGNHLTVDPTNPLRVPTAFGDHSWLPLPGYRSPEWLRLDPVPSHRVSVALDTAVGTIDTVTWSPADTAPDEPLPVLFAHDGPEMDELSGLTHFVGAMIRNGLLPRMRVVLLAPGDRNPRYAANPRYAGALAEEVVPTLLASHPSNQQPIIAGCSLGALAAFQAEWLHPGTFGGLWLGSGSFFTADLDAQEKAFAHWSPITSFVQDVLTAPESPTSAKVAVAVGTVEENRHNNVVMTDKLRSLGLEVSFNQVRDGHNYTCWRDLLDPSLTDLMARTWSTPELAQ